MWILNENTISPENTPQSKWMNGTRVAHSKNEIYDYSLDSKKPIILR